MSHCKKSKARPKQQGRENAARQMLQAAEAERPLQRTTHLSSRNNTYNVKKEALGPNTRR